MDCLELIGFAVLIIYTLVSLVTWLREHREYENGAPPRQAQAPRGSPARPRPRQAQAPLRFPARPIQQGSIPGGSPWSQPEEMTRTEWLRWLEYLSGHVVFSHPTNFFSDGEDDRRRLSEITRTAATFINKFQSRDLLYQAVEFALDRRPITLPTFASLFEFAVAYFSKENARNGLNSESASAKYRPWRK